MLRSVTTRLVAAYLVLFALALGAVLAALAWSTTRLIEDEIRGALELEAGALSEQYDTGGILGLARAIERRLGTRGDRDGVYLLTDRYGQPVAGNLGGWPPTLRAGQGYVEIELFRTDDSRPSLIAALSFRLEAGERLLVGRDKRALAQLEASLARALLWALGVGLAISLAAGWLMGRYVRRRIGEIAATAGEIIEGDLDRRVPVRGTGDEFDRLNATLNRMLDRIGALVASLRAVTDSLAHDLRSPLTRLRALTGDLTRGDLSAEDRGRLAARAEAESEAVLAIFADLIEIARAEAGVGRDGFEPVDLARLASDAAELYEPVAAERGVALVLATEAVRVGGSPQLLARALSNLLENALRAAPRGSTVAVSAGRQGGAAVLSVVDGGPGIPEHARARMLERFTRLDTSRSRDRGGGAGLGLALVKAVAELHGATLTLEDAGGPARSPGLAVRLVFGQGSGRDGGRPLRQSPGALPPARQRTGDAPCAPRH